jgi:hypothetical protein
MLGEFVAGVDPIFRGQGFAAPNQVIETAVFPNSYKRPKGFLTLPVVFRLAEIPLTWCRVDLMGCQSVASEKHHVVIHAVNLLAAF